jgi:hypothetical protein
MKIELSLNKGVGVLLSVTSSYWVKYSYCKLWSMVTLSTSIYFGDLSWNIFQIQQEFSLFPQISELGRIFYLFIIIYILVLHNNKQRVNNFHKFYRKMWNT